MSCWIEEEGELRLVASCFKGNYRWIANLHYAQFAGAFAPHPGHDPHLHPTLSAIQILLMQDALHLVSVDKVVQCEQTLQRRMSMQDR